eukprot:gene8512-14511_t
MTEERLYVSGENHSGVHIYHDRSTGSIGEDPIVESKRQWVEGRGINWILPNKRPEKLRDNLQDLEELLDTFKIAALKWKSIRHLQILFSNGTIVTITVSFNFADVDKILVDKSLVGKISDPIHNAVIEELYMVLAFTEKSKIGYIHYGKRPTERKEGEKLSSLELKVKLIDIPGPSGRAIDRRLSVNCRGDLVCVWWPSSSEAVWPWSPMAGDLGRMNLVVLSVSSDKLDVLCHIHTDLDPLSIAFSYNEPNQLFSVESSQSSSGSYTLKSIVYECNQSKEVLALFLLGNVIAEGRNHKEDKLLLACDDGSLVLYDEERQVTQTARTKFAAPSLITWHPNDAVVLVANSRADIQVFDQALTPLPLNLSFEQGKIESYSRLGQFFINSSKLDRASWACDFRLGPPPDAIGCYDDLLLAFDKGPICMMRVELGVLSNGRLGPVEIVSEYIQNKQELEAVNFLNSMNWNTNGGLCFACLTIIIDHLFRLPLVLDREAFAENALGSFYAPTRAISEDVMLQFRDPIFRLARRFFHHLLRHQRFEKAFLLAVDIGAKDLFMDIHYLALDMGNEPLAESAKQRAMHLHHEDLNSDEILDGENYASGDEADFQAMQQIGYRNDHGSHMPSFLYEPMTGNELKFREQQLNSNQTSLNIEQGHTRDAGGNSELRINTTRKHDRKYGMTLPSRNEVEMTEPKQAEPRDKMARKLSSSLAGLSQTFSTDVL